MLLTNTSNSPDILTRACQINKYCLKNGIYGKLLSVSTNRVDDFLIAFLHSTADISMIEKQFKIFINPVHGGKRKTVRKRKGKRSTKRRHK